MIDTKEQIKEAQRISSISRRINTKTGQNKKKQKLDISYLNGRKPDKENILKKI